MTQPRSWTRAIDTLAMAGSATPARPDIALFDIALFDIGANLTDRQFSSDLPQTLQRARAAGVTHIVVTGTDLSNSHAAVQLSAGDPQLLSCCVGVHPHYAAQVPEDFCTQLRQLVAMTPGVRAIGETGLDFNRDLSPRPVQQRVFEAQLELAAQLQLPVFVHDRDSQGHVAAILARYRHALTDVVVHCFTGDADTLDALLALDCHIGITGWVCDERRGNDLAALVPRIPTERLLIETDAPYLLPRSLQLRPRPRRNEPAFLGEVAQRIAILRECSLADVAAQTTANARRFFRLPVPD